MEKISYGGKRYSFLGFFIVAPLKNLYYGNQSKKIKYNE